MHPAKLKLLVVVLVLAACKSLPSVEDARRAVAQARIAQATACTLKDFEQCSDAEKALHAAETVLAAARAAENADAGE